MIKKLLFYIYSLITGVFGVIIIMALLNGDIKGFLFPWYCLVFLLEKDSLTTFIKAKEKNA